MPGLQSAWRAVSFAAFFPLLVLLPGPLPRWHDSGPLLCTVVHPEVSWAERGSTCSQLLWLWLFGSPRPLLARFWPANQPAQPPAFLITQDTLLALLNTQSHTQEASA